MFCVSGNICYFCTVLSEAQTFYLLKFPIESPPRKGNEQYLTRLGVRTKGVSLHTC